MIYINNVMIRTPIATTIGKWTNRSIKKAMDEVEIKVTRVICTCSKTLFGNPLYVHVGCFCSSKKYEVSKPLKNLHFQDLLINNFTKLGGATSMLVLKVTL